MVKQSPFQQDLFDFKYIEEQVAKIKKSMNENNGESEYVESDDMEASENKENIYELLKVQQLLLEDILDQLKKMNKKTKRKWF